MWKTKPAAQKMTIANLIGAGTVIEGDVVYTGGLRIDGKVKGNVQGANGQSGVVVISERGAVEGEVRASHLVISGCVQGPVFAAELVELQPKARITGDVHYKSIEMHKGSIVEGLLVHQPSRESRPDLKLAVAGTMSNVTQLETADQGLFSTADK